MSIILSVLLAVPQLAYAQAGGDEESVQKMRDLFEHGQDLYEQRKYDEAARSFRQAYEIRPLASLLYNEAVCYEKLKDYGKAANLFKRYLDESKNARDRKQVEQRIAALENEIGASRGEKPKPAPGQKKAPTLNDIGEAQTRGVFLIETIPPGATIYLDDKNSPPLGETPWNGTIDGKHVLIAVNKGYKDLKTDVVGKPNSVNTIKLALSQEHFLGWIEVRANIASADVYIDGKESGSVGRTPYMGNITPGKHTITITKEGFTEEAKTVDITAGEATKMDVSLEKAPIGFIHVGGSSVEGAVVKLDGKTVCEQAPCRFQSPSGDHRLSVEKKGLKTYNRKMTVVKATETALQVKLMPKVPRTDLIWKFGFAAAFLTGGIVLGLQANSVKSDLESDIAAGMPPLPPNDSRFTKGKIFAYAADGLFVIGTITAVVGVVSLLSEKGPPSSGVAESRDLAEGLHGPFDFKNAKIAPAVGPNYAGVAAEVRW